MTSGTTFGFKGIIVMVWLVYGVFGDCSFLGFGDDKSICIQSRMFNNFDMCLKSITIVKLFSMDMPVLVFDEIFYFNCRWIVVVWG